MHFGSCSRIGFQAESFWSYVNGTLATRLLPSAPLCPNLTNLAFVIDNPSFASTGCDGRVCVTPATAQLWSDHFDPKSDHGRVFSIPCSASCEPHAAPFLVAAR